jgi:hypothetical protein
VRHIPHRAASTTAAVDEASVARRPCFLCPENLDREEEGLPFGDFTVYANPFPILERHLTVVHREHRPQRIAGQAGAMLDLAAALPGFFVTYNGPRCGASAPDHLHLQAGARDGLPIVAIAARAAGPALEGYPAKAILLRGNDRSRLVHETDSALFALAAVLAQEPEPWVNVAVFHEPGAGWTLVLFPRGKHRPDAFHSGEAMVSPAGIDLCGILVAPREKDFERISGDDVAAVFREVTLPESSFREVLARLERP